MTDTTIVPHAEPAAERVTRQLARDLIDREDQLADATRDRDLFKMLSVELMGALHAATAKIRRQTETIARLNEIIRSHVENCGDRQSRRAA